MDKEDTKGMTHYDRLGVLIYVAICIKVRTVASTRLIA